MDTFFVRKQIIIGGVLLAVLEMSMILVKAFSH
jgi:hypothetical protein